MSASPRLRGAELAALAVGAIAIAIAMSFPLVLHLGTDIPQDLGDPVRTAWQVAWEGHALATQPLHLFSSNAFYPLGDSLAFSDSLLGYAPVALIGSGAKAALVRYDLLYLFAYALAFAAPTCSRGSWACDRWPPRSPERRSPTRRFGSR